MTLQVRLRPEAEQDVEEEARWYEQQKEGLGQEFIDQVLLTVRSIGEQPALYPRVLRNVRRALIHRFPFGIYYRVEEEYIVVVAVMHGSRSPQRWKRRT
ncbi:MAG: type II toxin-antitoxin system RelE/ParE family toxin [Candidatus Bipolaricaulota bacterium]|nr:type II toxin-antitoxin system RelE/ParE family toxin [Candidatus Bipolaricaulota bacterium]